MSNELCDRCGEAHKEWLDMYCQMCWEAYTAESWYEMIARSFWVDALEKARSLHPDFDSLPL